MEEKTYTLNIRQTSTYQYEVTVPEIGATKMAPTFDSVLTITLYDIVKHLTTRSLILVFTDHHTERNGWSVDSQQRSSTDLEHQAAIEIAQLDIAPQVKRGERHLVFELSCPLTREQFTWLNDHMGKLFERYYVIDELAFQFDELLEEERNNRSAAHE